MTIDEALDFVDNINRTVTFSKECKEDEDFFDSVGELLEELKALRSEKEYWNIQNHKAYQQGKEDKKVEIINLLAETRQELVNTFRVSDADVWLVELIIDEIKFRINNYN